MAPQGRPSGTVIPAPEIKTSRSTPVAADGDISILGGTLEAFIVNVTQITAHNLAGSAITK